jgi:trehalose 6-phosphate phosphatase
MTDSTPTGQAAGAAVALQPPPLPQSNWALFLDIDGTLLDIAESPDRVQVPARLLDDLQAAEKKLSGALALISGRPISEIDKLFEPLKLAASGQHGSEWRAVPGAESQSVSEAPLPVGLHEAAAKLGNLHPGIVVERKTHALAVHYRNAPDFGPEIGGRLAAAMAGYDGLMLLHGKAVWEIKDAQQSKGTAVGLFMRQPAFVDRVAVFVGDDRTDEDRFHAVEGMGGLALPVGQLALKRGHGQGKPIMAFATPAQVRKWLSDFAMRDEAAA